jgi:selenocysteine lyase/cysteine desulfurase
VGIFTDLRHADGQPAVALYGPAGTEDRGGTVAFNMLDRAGHVVPYGLVERAASEQRISIRGGCFCNPGAAEAAFGMPAEASLNCFEAMPRGEFSLKELADCLGNDIAVGALRATIGIATNHTDLDRLEAFLLDFVARMDQGSTAANEEG